MWSLRPGLGGGALRRPLGFWSKALPSVAGNDMLFTTQLLMCYKVLEKTDHLCMDHQVDHAAIAAHHKLDSTRSPSQKVQQQFIRSWTRYNWHWAQQHQRAEGSCMSRWPTHLYHPLPLHQCSPAPQLSYGCLRNFLYPA